MKLVNRTNLKKLLKSLLILAICMLLYIAFTSNGVYNIFSKKRNIINKRRNIELTNNKNQQADLIDSTSTIHFVIVICKGINRRVTNNQIHQAKLLMKSAAVLTRVVLRITVFSDSDQLYQDVISQVKQWPQEYQRRLQLEFQPVKYPPQSGKLRYLYKPCATFRLLLPDLLQNVDSAVYIDTDMIFLQPPENIWKEFNKFNKEEAVAIGVDCCYNRRKISFPYVGETGLNTGVFVMNLTRLRSAPMGGFTNSTLEIYQQFGELSMADQDIINIYFSRNIKLLRMLGCEWNYRTFHCRGGEDSCLEAVEHGASLVHGSAKAFRHNDYFERLSRAWYHYDIGTPFQTLLKNIQNQMKFLKSRDCQNGNNMTSVFTPDLMPYADHL